jgi:acetylornithine deacetylase/succinyl-diaminopimelate desuccinylase-like protein
VTPADLIAARTDELIDLTAELVRAPSPNPPGDERAVASVLARYLGELAGVEYRTFEPAPGRVTLVASVGDGSPSLVLAAHTDTHPAAAGWSSDPYGAEQLDGRMLGRGTTDNKGAVAAMALVFRALAEREGRGRAGRIVFVANADEETGGVHGVEALCASWDERPDAAIVAEPSGVFAPWEALWTGARGTSRFTIKTCAPRTHSSLAGRNGVVSALEALQVLLARLTDQLETLRRRDPAFALAPRLTVVSLAGGEGFGVVPGGAEAQCELRVLPGSDQGTVETDVRSTFEAVRAEVGIDATLEFAAGGLRWMAPSSVPPDAPIVSAATEAWRTEFGSAPSLDCFPGGTDARLFAAAGVPAVIVGPGALSRAHQPDEYVTIDELVSAARVYAAVVSLFTEAAGPAS